MKERIKRVNSLLRKEISEIVLKEIEFPGDVLVTVSRVETSVDLKKARVFVSVMPEERTKQIMDVFNRQIYSLQQIINKKLNMRPIPQIIFRQDKETVRADRIEKILEEIKKQEED